MLSSRSRPSSRKRSQAPRGGSPAVYLLAVLRPSDISGDSHEAERLNSRYRPLCTSLSSHGCGRARVRVSEVCGAVTGDTERVCVSLPPHPEAHGCCLLE